MYGLTFLKLVPIELDNIFCCALAIHNFPGVLQSEYGKFNTFKGKLFVYNKIQKKHYIIQIKKLTTAGGFNEMESKDGLFVNGV